jgi:hypothetical protein
MLLTELIARIPESIGGVITGSVLTLIGVWMTNRHNLRQQRQEFEFERGERQRERQVSLRRDVYLPAADAITSMVSAMAKMLGGETSSAEQITAGAQAFGAALTRIQMVATPGTVRCVAEYQRAFLRAISVLQKLNHPMMLRKADIEIAHNTRQGYHDERMKCIELMKEYNLAGMRDPQRFQRIEQQAAYAGQRWAEAHSEWLLLMHAQETARLEMVREFGGQMTELAKLQAPVLAAIRGELEASDASALIAEETQKTTTVGLQSMADMIPFLESGIERLRADVQADVERRRNAP